MLKPAKLHKNYDDLVDLLIARGMVIDDKEYAYKKIKQVGYYRLSGFSYPCRLRGMEANSPRLETFHKGTYFRDVYRLYLFDKKLRLLMLDALERIEIYVRSVIAHELGKENHIAYLHDKFINPKHLKQKGNTKSKFETWQKRHNKKLKDNHEECITWHNNNYQEIPFWVAIEVWDFGLLSKYYAMLKDSWRNRILTSLDISAGNGAILQNWLSAMNVLRNRCAHHSRIWNKLNEPCLKPLPGEKYFTDLNLDTRACQRMYGMLAVLWFLLKRIGSGSQWLSNVKELIDTMPLPPGCDHHAMGFPTASNIRLWRCLKNE